MIQFEKTVVCRRQNIRPQYGQMLILIVFPYKMFFRCNLYLFKDRHLNASLAVVALCLAAMFSQVSAQDTGDDGGDAVAIFNQGQDAHEKGDLKGAVELYQKALKITPEFPEAELQLGNAFLGL